MDFEKIFTSWPYTISKARQAKGLENWARLQRVAHLVAGKGPEVINFTAIHPETGELTRHIIGSVEGNLKFLLGYVNPGFSVCKYHWMLIDPSLSEEQAEGFLEQRGHPGRMDLWDQFNQQPFIEGDIEEGHPHPDLLAKMEEERMERMREENSVAVQVGYGLFRIVPFESVVYAEHNGHIYDLRLVQDTYFSAFHPEAVEFIHSYEINKSIAPKRVRAPVNVERTEWDEDVYPFVKSVLPGPGNVLILEDKLFGVITNNSIDFYDKQGNRAGVEVYDSVYKSFDLRKEGNIHGSVLVDFLVNHFDLERGSLEEIAIHKALPPSSGVVAEDMTPDANVQEPLPDKGGDSPDVMSFDEMDKPDKDAPAQKDPFGHSNMVDCPFGGGPSCKQAGGTGSARHGATSRSMRAHRMFIESQGGPS